ncbi:MAG: hypothetical protein BYD32DRAFT_461540 [Podila humilis]|nr:MAG: hypothetical protein BYD32DRAFT_461540 [Podila humilis]
MSREHIAFDEARLCFFVPKSTGPHIIRATFPFATSQSAAGKGPKTQRSTTTMTVFLGILTLSYFYLLLPDTKIYRQQQLLDQEYQRFIEGRSLPSVTSIVPGMPMANNLAQVLEWIACGLGEGVYKLMIDALL